MDDKLTRLAFKLADDHAAVHFRCNCYSSDTPRGWYVIPPAFDRDGYTNRILRYLRARKMLERHPDNSDLWRTVKAPK